MNSAEDQAKIELLAQKTMKLCRDDLLIHLRFLDVAMSRLKEECVPATGCIATDGATLVYDPVFVLKTWKESPALLTRTRLHSLMHCIFVHPFGAQKLDSAMWDLATDIATEAVISELGLSSLALETDRELAGWLKVLREDAGGLSAEKIYRYFRANPPSDARIREWQSYTMLDSHSMWRSDDSALEITQEQWQQMSRRIRTQIKAFDHSHSGESLEENLDAGAKTRVDYGRLLQRFTSMGETVRSSEDEFDYIFYTYGLELYGNLPLIEPLEYREEKRLREFVIALDTSASCRGPVVKGFLRKTFDLLTAEETLFDKVNIHIIQCDSEIQNDTRITSREDLDFFLQNGRLSGFGATDFRPVFGYVNELIRKGEFENLKGLIYFTDGFGIYPQQMPPYSVLFAFLNPDRTRPDVPHWALTAVLEDDELEAVESHGHK